MSWDRDDIVLVEGKRGVVRWTDKCTGHDDFQPRGCVEASKNVFINGKGVHRLGDKWKMHYSVVLLNPGDTPKPYKPGDKDYPASGNGELVTDDHPDYPGPPLNPGDPGYPGDLPPDPGPPPTPPAKPKEPSSNASEEEKKAYQEALKKYQEDLKAFNEGPMKEWQEKADKGPPYHGDTIYPSMDEYPDLGDSHDSISASGSANVFVNGLPLCRVGDEVECGSRMKFGSKNVFVN